MASSLSPIKRSSRLTISQSKTNISPVKLSRRRPPEESKAKVIDELLSSSPPAPDDSLVSKSKERVTELTSGILPETAALKELLQQLHVRDGYIEILKNKLIDLSVDKKILESESVASRDRALQQLLRDKAELLKSVSHLEAENQKLLSQSGDKIGHSDKDNLELLVDGLTEETEQLKAKLTAKDAILASMKKDLEQLSGIIQEMTGLNKDLNDKIAAINVEMEKKNREHYQAMIKAQHMEETEKALAEQQMETQKLQEKLTKMTEITRRVQEMEEAAEQFRTAFAALEPRLPSDLRPQVDTLKAILPRFQVGSLRKPPEASLLKDKVKQLELELRATSRDLSRVSANESALRTRLTTQEDDHEHAKLELKAVIDQLNKTISTLQSGLNGFSDRNEKLYAELQTAKGEAQKAATKVVNLQIKVEKANNALSQAVKSESKAVLALKEAQAQLSQLRLVKTTTEATLQMREQKVKEDANKLKVLTEELWKRDTLILKKSGELVKSQEDLQELKTVLQQIQSRNRVVAVGDSAVSGRGSETKTHSRSPVIRKSKIKVSGSQKTHGQGSIYTQLETLTQALELKSLLEAGVTPSEVLLKTVLMESGGEGNRVETVGKRIQTVVKEIEETIKTEGKTIEVRDAHLKEKLRLSGDVVTCEELLTALHSLEAS